MLVDKAGNRPWEYVEHIFFNARIIYEIPQIYYSYKYSLPCFSLSLQIVLFIYIKHQISTRNVKTNVFSTKYIPSNRFTQEILCSTKGTAFKMKHSAFRSIRVSSAKAYVNQFLALPNAMYSLKEY